jgi:hypothetical protein
MPMSTATTTSLPSSSDMENSKGRKRAYDEENTAHDIAVEPVKKKAQSGVEPSQSMDHVDMTKLTTTTTT